MASRDELLESIINAALALPFTKQVQFLEDACSDSNLHADARSTLLALLEKSKESLTLGGTPDAPYRSSSPDRTGLTFDSYRVLRQLGAGGMGEVYLALDSRLGRSVALKFVPRSRIKDEQTMKRFIQEARTASALNHPNILTVYEVGENDGDRYLATEYVDGGTLRTEMRKHGVTLGDALDIAIQVASALVASHRAGIIHRDLKPTNIMLRKDGYVKVIDFGLAKLTDAARESSSFPAGEAYTTPGSLLGTVGYMSPEQARGEEVDARTDIWSLGVILFEMITGQRPFEGETDSHVMVAIMERPMPGLPYAPPALERTLQRALAKQRNRRYQQASEMLDDLRGIRQQLDISVSSRQVSDLQTLRKRRISWKVPVGFAAALLIPLLALIVWGPALFPSPETFEIGSIRQVTFNGHVGQAALSRNGEELAISAGEPGVDEAVQIRRLGGQADEGTTVIPAAAHTIKGLTFSPDNQFLYVVVKGSGRDLGKLYRVSVAQSPVEVLEDLDGPISFSPDGSQFAYVRFAEQETSYRDELVIAETAHPTSPSVLKTKQGDERLGRRVAWSERGDVIACILYRQAPDGVRSAIIDLVPVTLGKKEQVVPQKGWESIGQLAWLNGGHDLVAVVSGQGETFDEARLQSIFVSSGKTQMLTGGGLLDGTPGYRSVSVSDDHQRLATVRLTNNARVWVSAPNEFDRGDYAGAEVQPAGDLAWSKDGRIAFSSRGQGHRDLWVLNPSTKSMQAITNSPFTDRSPVWVPGQNSVVFSSNRTGGYGIWRYDLDSRHYEQLTGGPFDDEPTVSPDGSRVVYTRWKGSYAELWQVPAKGGGGVRVSIGQARSPSFSPDGRGLLCMRRADTPAAPWRTALVSIPEGKVLKLVTAIPAGQRAYWVPGRQEIAYIRTQGGVSNVVVYSLETNTVRDVTHFQEGQIERMGWAPGGRQLALIRANKSSDAILVLRKSGH